MTLEPLSGAPPAVQIHLVAVAAALAGLGIVVAGRKGTRLHKHFGRVFVAGMVGAAVSSFWIMEINDGTPSFIHIISVATLIGLVFAVRAARLGDIRRHRSMMTYTAVGGLGVAGGFAVFAPGRLIWQMLFG